MTEVYDDIVSDLGRFSSDPEGFVLWAFPWGEPGTILESKPGPFEWQLAVLRDIKSGLLTIDKAIQLATSSGHGIGKSALVAWLCLWAISTFEDTRGVVTANTETQLKTKTWAELGKWYHLFIAKSLFKLTATALFSADPERDRTWRIDMVPWSERNAEAFAGLHNEGKRILLLFDEASNIPDIIWETAEGALTDTNTQIIWAAFGNPTKNSGRFRMCFREYAHVWHTRQIDARTVPGTNKALFSSWVRDRGEDSDFVRVRVKGEFPRVGLLEFISSEDVAEAMVREVEVHLHDPLVLGVDVARFGDDESVIFIRKGRDGRSHPARRFSGIDTMALAGHVAAIAQELRPDAIFVDGGGVGGGVVDRLRQLNVDVFDIQFGGRADQPQADRTLYANKRAEMWGGMRSWIKGAALPDDKDLREQLVAPTYSFRQEAQILLESKAEMKLRGVPSPDLADALALTFAYPVIASRFAGRYGAREEPRVLTEWDPFAKEVA